MKEKKFIFFCILFILFVGAFLRIYGLDSRDLSNDEVMSIYRFEVVRSIYDPHPPLYYMFLKLWIWCFGKSEFAVRFLSLLTGLGSLLVVYKIGEVLASKGLGIASAFLLALSPLHILYSQEARNYSLTIFLTLVCTLTFLLCLKKDKVYLWAIFFAATSLSIYTNYFSFFFFIAEGALFALKEYRPLFKKWLLSICLSVVLFLPILPMIIKQVLFIKDSFWILKPTIKSLIITFENFNIGYNGTSLMYVFSWIFFVFFTIGAIHLFYYRRNSLFLLLSFLFVHIAAVFLISKLKPIYVDKQLMFFSPFYYIIIAQGLIKLKPYFIRIFLVGTICILMGFSLRNYFMNDIPTPYQHHLGVVRKKTFKGIREYFERNFKEGDIIAHANKSTTISLKFYYWGNNPSVHYYLAFPYLLDSYHRNTFYSHIKYGAKTVKDFSQQSAKQFVAKFKRIWLVTTSWEGDGRIDENSQEVKKWMDSNFTKTKEEQFEGIWITLYKSK